MLKPMDQLSYSHCNRDELVEQQGISSGVRVVLHKLYHLVLYTTPHVLSRCAEVAQQEVL